MEQSLFDLPDPEDSKPDLSQGTPRLKRANRQQLEWRAVDLDSQIAEDHPVRVIWELVESLDLAAFYASIKAVEGHAGQSAIDPRILLAVWLYAVTQGVGSARQLDRLCQEHIAYRWLCGGVSVNYHTLADFRSQNGDALDQLLTKIVAALLFEGWVKLEQVAHDGKRVRASAGSASFRRRKTLERCQQEAQAQVECLRQELEENPAGLNARQKAARQRAARERQEHMQAALKRLEKLEAKQQKQAKKVNQKQRKSEPRVSTSDPEAQRMKMGDGGYRPAYNVQVSSDTQARIIVNVAVTNQGNDGGLLQPMLEQVEGRYVRKPAEVLMDGGFVTLADITQAERAQVCIYAPVPAPRKEGQDPHAPHPEDTREVIAWRQRMATDEAKETYKKRASTAEWVNAWLDNWGLQRFRVRGLKAVRAVVLLYALAFDLLQGRKLRLAAMAARA